MPITIHENLHYSMSVLDGVNSYDKLLIQQLPGVNTELLSLKLNIGECSLHAALKFAGRQVFASTTEGETRHVETYQSRLAVNVSTHTAFTRT
jgi:hypothetical protein